MPSICHHVGMRRSKINGILVKLKCWAPSPDFMVRTWCQTDSSLLQNVHVIRRCQSDMFVFSEDPPSPAKKPSSDLGSTSDGGFDPEGEDCSSSSIAA